MSRLRSTSIKGKKLLSGAEETKKPSRKRLKTAAEGGGGQYGVSPATILKFINVSCQILNQTLSGQLMFPFKSDVLLSHVLPSRTIINILTI